MGKLSDRVKRVVLLMFENRSFDHMLGHLSLEGINPAVDGLKKPLTSYSNTHLGDTFNPYPIEDDTLLDFDLPHEYDSIKAQLRYTTHKKLFSMKGFVESYAAFTKTTPNLMSIPMGFFSSRHVPITSFLARSYCTCDRWFTPLPTSTQPNRTMAFYGKSPIHTTKTRLIEMKGGIFEWMNAVGLHWRVYHDGLSFFALYPNLWSHVLGPNFSDFENFYADTIRESRAASPQVIIVEPSYDDAPHIGSDHPNDNHAPLPVGWGEEFLRNTYRAVTANPEKWKETVFIVYYDEHGGFWDHVSPPKIGYRITDAPHYQFNNLGPRIPALIISPLVDVNSTSHLLFDHTSVLQFLAELFTPGIPFNATVEGRKRDGIRSISEALTLTKPRENIPVVPSAPITVKSALGQEIRTATATPLRQSFGEAARRLVKEEPSAVAQKYPELIQWVSMIKPDPV